MFLLLLLRIKSLTGAKERKTEEGGGKKKTRVQTCANIPQASSQTKTTSSK